MAFITVQDMSDFLGYRAVRSHNRETFLLNYANLIRAFVLLDESFTVLAASLNRRDKTGSAHVSLIPLLLLMQRQSRSSFDAISSHQSYEGWVLLRPAIEATLIMGKWMDRPEMARIWANRFKDAKRYRQEYSGGDKLRSQSLPRSVQIQGVLGKVNDNFLHPNPDYVLRHLDASPVGDAHIGLQVNYFDTQTQTAVNALAWLHLISVIQDSCREMLLQVFASVPEMRLSPADLRREFLDQVRDLGKEKIARAVLVDFGLWPNVWEPPPLSPPSDLRG